MINLILYNDSGFFNLHDNIMVIQLVSDSVVTDCSQVLVEDYLVGARNVMVILTLKLRNDTVNQFFIVENFIIFLWIGCVNRFSQHNLIEIKVELFLFVS